MNKKISVIIPVYNEASTIENLLNGLTKIACYSFFDWEYIFVDDGSKDDSFAKIELAAKNDPRVMCVSLTRNFGKEIAVSAGVKHASGDAVVIIDADLQHPPEVISEFVNKWNEGFLVVNGVRAARQHDGFIRSVGARIFYSLLAILSSGKNPTSESTDFCLIDRIVVDEFLRLKEHRRLNRALVDWLGFQSAPVEFAVADRLEGRARYSYQKLVRTAIGAIVSNSQVPLSLAGYLGCAITFFAGFLGLFVIIEQLFLKDPLKINASASAMMAIFILFLNGIVLMCLGLMSLYIGSIHEETLGRPLYVVAKKINFSSSTYQKSSKQEVS